MNRMEEFMTLQRELENEPAALQSTTLRCLERVGRARKRARFWKIPVSAVAAALACFVILANTSVAFARSVGGIPLLSDLAKAVTYEPGLKAAIDNEYVQPVGLSQTKDGVTLSIPYLIADKSQLVLFYSLHSADGRSLELRGAGLGGLTDEFGKKVEYTSYCEGPENGAEALQKIHYQFTNGSETPEKIHLELIAADRSAVVPDAPAAANFTMDVSIDHSLFQEPEKFGIQKEYSVSGQRLIVQSVEIAPTMTKITLDTPKTNTALLRNIAFSLSDEQGNMWSGRKNGITATFDPFGDNVRDVYLESNFFSHSKHLYLKLESVGWLPKSMRTVEVDVKNKTASPLSDSIRMTQLEQNGSRLNLTFEKPIDGKNLSQIFSSVYSDSAGNWDVKSFSDRSSENRMEEIVSVNHWKGGIIYLTRDWTPPAVPNEPVVITLK
ncbi:DUF4179 domain-containing protein [Caproicibacter fermentans]|uniref:DUF4179 domain-containing protein n=1 Tax=Caproicibacter fermentans TaxID=2576756 RepID=A0A7G8TB98_9FIRM|nr:DUF4179 domain-containing protein [Caproicibacter fermentans]QNK40889.1 DUF4179 domain-containing protein [Caproicibacter fermentans]